MGEEKLGCYPKTNKIGNAGVRKLASTRLSLVRVGQEILVKYSSQHPVLQCYCTHTSTFRFDALYPTLFCQTFVRTCTSQSFFHDIHTYIQHYPQSLHRVKQNHIQNAFPFITPSAHEQPLRHPSCRRSLRRLLHVPLHRAPVAVCKMERRNGQPLLRTRRTIPTGIKMHSRQILSTRKPPPSKHLPIHGRK